MVIWPEDNGTYSAEFPDLPGCFTMGETLGACIHNGEDAVETYLSMLRASGKPIPKPRHRVATVEARVPSKKVG